MSMAEAEPVGGGAITRFAGSVAFIYLHAALLIAWLAVNLGWTPGAQKVG